MGTHNFKVLILNPEYLSALDSVREFGKKGIKVISADPKKWKMTNFSKYAKYAKCPDIKDTENFIGWLKESGKNGLFDVILSTSDLMVWYLSSREKELSKCFKVSVPNKVAVEASLFKDKMNAVCIKNKIPTPKTYFPKSSEEVKKISKKVKYPAIIKHITNVGIISAKKGVVVESPDELLKNYAKDTISYDRKNVLKSDSGAEFPMVQELISDISENSFMTIGISSENGNKVSIMCSKKIRQQPPKIGIATATEPVDNQVPIIETIKFLKAVKYNGNFITEFLYDKRDGLYKLIDFNPRLGGSSGLAVANGLNLPLLWYDELYNGKSIEEKTVKGSRIYVHSANDVLYLPGNILHSKKKLKSVKEVFRTYLRPKKFAVFSLDDPLPFIIDVVMILRNKIKHPIFYLRENWQGE